MTQNSLFIFMYMHEVVFTTPSWTFFVAGSCLTIFGWFVFFMYGTLALKGVTIIESSAMFAERRQSVIYDDSVTKVHDARTANDKQRELSR